MIFRFAAVVCLEASLAVFSFADSTICPATIDVHQQLATPPSGWALMTDDAPHQLSGVTFFDGTPQEKASLVYNDMKKIGGKQIASWSFAPKSGRQTWIACSYSATDIELTKALPASTRSCN